MFRSGSSDGAGCIICAEGRFISRRKRLRWWDFCLWCSSWYGRVNLALVPKQIMKTLQIALFVGLLVVAVGGEENEAVKKDLAALQGEWIMVAGTADGQEMPEELRNGMKRVCKGDETSTTMRGEVFMKAKFSIDPSKAPKTIDYEMVEGFTKG